MAMAMLDNNYLAVGSGNDINIWKIGGSTPLRGESFKGHIDLIRDIIICTHKQNFMLSASDDSSIKMWNT